MKKTFRTFNILILAVLMIFTSCSDKLQKIDDGSVNEYIYPYIRFEPVEDGTAVKAEVLIFGNKPVKIPESAFVGDKELPVNSLKVAEGIKDIPEGSLSNVTSVKQIELPDSVEKIGRNSLPSTVEHLVVPESRIDDLPAAFPEGNRLAEITVRGSGATVGNLDLSNFGSLDKVNIERPETAEPAVWPEMKPLEKEGYVFLGWYTENGTRITAGMSIEKGQEQAYPRWESKDNHGIGGNFDVSPVFKYTKGTLVATREGNMLHIEFKDSRPEYKAETFEWYVSDELREINTTGRFSLDVSEPRSYQIMCVFGNKWGKNSETIDIVGGTLII